MPKLRKFEEADWIARIDVKGRVIVPSELRDLFKLKPGDYVKVRLVGILEPDEE